MGGGDEIGCVECSRGQDLPRVGGETGVPVLHQQVGLPTLLPRMPGLCAAGGPAAECRLQLPPHGGRLWLDCSRSVRKADTGTGHI